jgi:hypothetical protein
MKSPGKKVYLKSMAVRDLIREAMEIREDIALVKFVE